MFDAYVVGLCGGCEDFMCVLMFRLLVFFFFKQKTAYEIRNCDWSSDVCSSDLCVSVCVCCVVCCVLYAFIKLIYRCLD